MTNDQKNPANAYLVSKTDARGVITYANDAFVAISGFPRNELVGQPHSIVRHSDMPKEAFEDLWRTVKTGMPWRGKVKNKTKAGSHYWVDSFVVPIRENNQTVGFMSVRTLLSNSDIQKAEAHYAALRNGKASLSNKPPIGKRITIRARLIAMMIVMSGLLSAGSFVGLNGVIESNDALKDSYYHEIGPIETIGRVVALMGDNRSQLLLGIQHDSMNPIAHLHDHALSVHTDKMVETRKEIDTLVKSLDANSLSPELASLFAQFMEARAHFVEKGLPPARKAMLAGDFLEANTLMIKVANPAYEKAAEAGKKIQDALKLAAKRNHEARESHYIVLRNQIVFGAIFGLILVLLVTWNLTRAIVHPFRRIISHFDSLAQGNLTDVIDISGRDEAGQVLTQLAAMQVQLKVMLDEINVATSVILQQAGAVDKQTTSVADQSERQRDRAASIATATEEFSHSVRGVAASANIAADQATESQRQVSLAQASMNESTASTTRVVSAVQESSLTITNLDNAIGKIGAISQTIKDIAEQTNLLALNAAIEAARAGDQGRGFAVVADEVRKLAERTTLSTKDITMTISEIRGVTDAAVISMARAVGEVESGIAKIQESTTGLSLITHTSHKVTEMAHHIAEAANEQAAASEQVASNMEQMATLIDGNLESVRSARNSAGQVNRAALDLRQAVGKFKLI